MSAKDYLDAAEISMRMLLEGRCIAPGYLHADSSHGEFHIKTGGLALDEGQYFGAKLNGGFFQNRIQNNLPNILGIIYLCDSKTGEPLVMMESTEITGQRTAAASAIAAKSLARENSSTMTIIGSGNQARTHATLFKQIFPLQKINIWSRSGQSAQALARELSASLNIETVATEELSASVQDSDICITCTSAREILLHEQDLAPGLFIAAVGTDSPGKQELEPQILAKNKLVTDITQQCVAVGETQHAIKAGLLLEKDIYSEIGEIICKNKPGREDDKEIIIYDSTGTALQDVAAASLVYRKAQEQAKGTALSLW